MSEQIVQFAKDLAAAGTPRDIGTTPDVAKLAAANPFSTADLAKAYLLLKSRQDLLVDMNQEYEKQLEIISKVLGKLHPIGEVKFIGYREIETAIRDCLDMVLEELDPEMQRHHIVRLREKFIAAKSAITN